jgi:UDP-2,4-diacetamido-2,4,6-trideoxy-beta-L-altropyranose hydrolase
MNVLIRVDAYPEIALGHLERCIRLGQTLVDIGHEITFISYDDHAAKTRLEEKEFIYHLIPYKVNYAGVIDEELNTLAEFSEGIDLLIVDSYSVDGKYFEMLNDLFLKVVYLDDLGLDFKVDMVINPSCKVQQTDYVATNVLCGMDYVILGNEYVYGRVSNRTDKCDSLLITMGGIDHYDLSSRLIPMIETINKNIEVNLIIGPYYENTNRVKTIANNSKLHVNIFEGLSNISSVILESDIAVTAGGFTTYELAAMSTPCVGIALWNNQKENIECLSKKEALIPLYYSDGAKFDEDLKESLNLLIGSDKLRAKMAILARNAIDGRGASRISEKITKLYA